MGVPLFRAKRLFLVWSAMAVLAASFAGCSVLDSTLHFFGYGKPSTPQTPEGMAMEAMDLYSRGKYHSALKLFEEIKDRFPFSEAGLLAELKAADCNFYMKKYDEALVLYEEFEGNHPTNEAIPYVLFQIGMCHYEQIDTVDRDPGSAVEAIAAFSRLVKGFPDSPYREEAEARLAAARDFLARHEMYVAAFYVKTGEYDQAKGRLTYLLATYPDSSVAESAKDLLARIESGNPPRRSWRDWLPDLSLPSWRSFVRSVAGDGAAPAVPGN